MLQKYIYINPSFNKRACRITKILSKYFFMIDIIIHLDAYLSDIVKSYGFWIYLILFLIVFCETGLVVTPFLPGDSLLFATGALAAADVLNIAVLFIIFAVAGIAGDAANYSIGNWMRPRIFRKENVRFLNKKHLEKTQNFYDKHGGKTIIFARFMPIIRTFAPFVAGIGSMNYSRFAIYNITGCLIWVSVFTVGGYYFGNLPFIKERFHIMILVIILLSILPVIISFVRSRRAT